MMKEHPIYKGYYGTKEGRLFSTKWNKLKELKPILQKSNNGYLLMCCYVDGVRHQVLPHRFIADIFIPNPDNLPEINHIDEDKTNNSIENLEWCTRKHNVAHSLAKEYMIENLKTGEKKRICCLSDWCKDNGVGWDSAMKNLQGKIKTIKKRTYRIYRVEKRT